MEVKVITQTVTSQALEALRKGGCDKAKENKQSVADIELTNILIRQDIEKLKEKLK